MADGVIVPLAEFIAVNAGFSLSSDLAAQMLEGKHLRAPPTPQTQHPVEAKPKIPRRRRQKDVRKSPGLAGGAAGACPAQQTRLSSKCPTLASLAADGSASDDSSPRASDHTENEEKLEGSGDEKEVKTAAWVEPPMLHPAPEMVDWGRAAAFAGTGVLFCGVAQFVRLRVIDEVFDKNDTTLYTAAAKTGVNQLLFSPLIRAASMVTITYHATQDWDQVTRALKEDFFEAQTVSYMVKPVSNMAAFALFPNHILAQAVVMRGVAFGYNVYYSFVTHKRTSMRDTEDADRAGGAPTTASDGHITVELCCDAAPVPPRTSPQLPSSGLNNGVDAARPCMEQPTSSVTGYVRCDATVSRDTPQPSSKQMRRSLDGAPADVELDDLRTIVARRRERWAEWENKQRRAARLRRERQQQAEQKRARGNCQWLTGVASTVGLSWA